MIFKAVGELRKLDRADLARDFLNLFEAGYEIQAQIRQLLPYFSGETNPCLVLIWPNQEASEGKRRD